MDCQSVYPVQLPLGRTLYVGLHFLCLQTDYPFVHSQYPCHQIFHCLLLFISRIRQIRKENSMVDNLDAH